MNKFILMPNITHQLAFTPTCTRCVVTFNVPSPDSYILPL